MMSDARCQGFQFLNRLDLMHLFYERLQRLNRYILDVLWKKWLKLELRDRERGWPKPPERLLPGLRITLLEGLETGRVQ